MLQILHKKRETNKNISRKCLNSNVGMAVVKNGQQQDYFSQQSILLAFSQSLHI